MIQTMISRFEYAGLNKVFEAKYQAMLPEAVHSVVGNGGLQEIFIRILSTDP